MTDDQKAKRDKMLADRRVQYYHQQGYVLVKDGREEWFILKLAGSDTVLRGDGSKVGWLRAVVLFGPGTYAECEARLLSKVIPVPEGALSLGLIDMRG